MTITNFKNLAKNPLRKKALLITEAGYGAIDIEKAVSGRIKIDNNLLVIQRNAIIYDSARKITKINLDNFRRIFIIGIGKGSALASATLAKILDKRLTGGIALDVQSKEVRLPKIGSRTSKILKFLTGTHPLPSKQNVKATKEIVKLAKSLKKDDLLITFICGGGSALLCGFEKEMRYSRTIFKELTKAGANILELNTVRKHLSEVKGGNLAKFVYPATVISLIVSDVLGNDLSMVASGPTAYDKTAKKDAEKILKNYQLPITNYQLLETPKDKKYFKKIKNILFLSNREPISAMAEKAKKLGLKPKIYSLKLKGEAKKALLLMIKKAKQRQALIAGGETTVKLKTEKLGKGGRNMEAVLGALVKCQMSNVKCRNRIVLSFASDGRDNTEAAGAIGDILTIKKSQKLKLNPREFLYKHNSFHFFAKTGDLIYADKKSFNVADLMVILKV